MFVKNQLLSLICRETLCFFFVAFIFTHHACTPLFATNEFRTFYTRFLRQSPIWLAYKKLDLPSFTNTAASPIFRLFAFFLALVPLVIVITI